MNYTPEEQAAHRAELVAALRSGDYAQGHGVLRAIQDEGAVEHCCLGVACDISGLGSWLNSDAAGTTAYRTDQGAVVTQFLPPDVMAYFGFTDRIATLFENSTPREGDALTELNDDGAGFDEIAELIETGNVQVVA